MRLFILTAFFSHCFGSVFGQTNSKCGTVYEISDSMAQYKGGIGELMKYFTKEQVPILSSCVIDLEAGTINSLYIVFTISNSGRVIDAAFPRSYMSEQCAEKLRTSLLQMKGWSPAILNGKKVCSFFKLPIGCLKWD